MWLIKGLSAGIVAFLLLTVMFLIALIMGSNAKAMGVTVFYSRTIHNPLYWLALVLVLAGACSMFRLSN